MSRAFQMLKLIFIFLFAFAFFILKCKNGDRVPAGGRESIIISFYPEDRSLVFPSGITIYVDLAVKPDPAGIIFSVWREGESVPGTINVEEVEKKFRVSFNPIERSEGTYIVYFRYGSEEIFWGFFAEGEYKPLIFPENSVPFDGEKNFPLDNTIYVSFAYLINPDTIDEETVKLLMIKPTLEEDKVPIKISFFPNSIIILPELITSSANYKVEITRVVSLPYENNPGTLSYRSKFRSIDLTPPYIVGCSPDFCVKQCAQIGFLRSLELKFREDEELDEWSVVDSFILERDGRKLVFSEIYRVFDAVELLVKNIRADPVKLYIYRNKIFVDFGSGISVQSTVRIYILPKLSDSSGNTIDSFFSWCVEIH